MICKISGCTHVMSRRGAMNRNFNSWSFNICPCCAVQLKFLGGLKGFDLTPSMMSSGCKFLLEKENLNLGVAL